jgi:hypothetical protein
MTFNTSVLKSDIKHGVSITNTSESMPFRDTVAVYRVNHMKHMNAMPEENAKHCNAKEGGTVHP